MLAPYPGDGTVDFEYSIPRLGRRIDVVVVLRAVIFVLEFKVGEREFKAAAIDQVCDYALDHKNFHEGSHDKTVAPVLIATSAENVTSVIAFTPHNDQLLLPIRSTAGNLAAVFHQVLAFADGPRIDPGEWESSRCHRRFDGVGIQAV